MSLRRSVPLLFLLPGLLALLRPPALPAQAGGTVEGRVVDLSGATATLDIGSETGLQPGDRVRLLPLGRPAVEAEVVSVGDRRAEVRLLGPAEGIVPGTRCEATIPPGRRPAGGQEAPPEGVPEHPPWEEPIEDWDTNQPLLARGLDPEDRPMVWRGRVYTSFDRSEYGGGEGSSFNFARGGVDVDVQNPFGQGGGLHLDVEFNWRSFESGGVPSTSETTLRLDRLSYDQGGTRQQALFFEAGRFLQNEFPEFGLLDGVEVGYRLGEANRFGASVGYMPEPTSELGTGDDLQTAVFYSYTDPEEGLVRFGGGYQRTWHDGTADRDLLLGKLRYGRATGLYLSSTAWLDLYDSQDTAKGSGTELTEFQVHAGLRSEGGDGLLLGYRRSRFPETLRFQVFDTTDPAIFDREYDRLDLRGWWALTPDWRVSAGVNRWTDEGEDGFGGDLRFDWQRVLADRVDLGCEAFINHGLFTSVTGLRADASLPTASGTFRAGFESAEYRNQGVFEGDATDLQHVLRLGWDHWLDSGLSLSARVDQRFGENQDTLSLGLFLQQMF